MQGRQGAREMHGNDIVIITENVNVESDIGFWFLYLSQTVKLVHMVKIAIILVTVLMASAVL